MPKIIKQYSEYKLCLSIMYNAKSGVGNIIKINKIGFDGLNRVLKQLYARSQFTISQKKLLQFMKFQLSHKFYYELAKDF